jgi:hypothetical protein
LSALVAMGPVGATVMTALIAGRRWQ